MPSERIQRQIDRLLDEAEEALSAGDWPLGQTLLRRVLARDPESSDANALLEVAERGLTQVSSAGASPRPPGYRGGAPSRRVGGGQSSDTPNEGQGEGQPERQYHPQEPLAGAGGSPALRGAAIPRPHPSLPASLPQAERGEPASFVNGRYTVQRFLGEGGKKIVYLAHDTVLDRDVAFALIKTDGLDETARQRIAREAQAMGRLGSHPHIVTVFDLGEEPGPHPGPLPILGVGERAPLSLAGEGQGEGETRAATRPRGLGQPYMVTELMGGGDVEGLIERAPEHKLPLAQALQIAEQVCAGLEFAHERGIVHRDLKPGNVWLTSSEQRATGNESPPVAKIGDFGLAVAIDRSRLTQAGMMVGTVNYMPPEQAMGGEVTPRSDLYSLGAMLYEMVTGRPPFVGDDAVAIIGQHLNTPPVSPAWHRPDCPAGLETLILRLLEKDANKRPASASEVRVVLESVATVGTGAMNRAPTPGATAAGVDSVGAGFKPARPGEAPERQAPYDNPLYRRVFVGREAELRQLQRAFDAALSGQGGLAMVVGEPGIGKTAVCEQLATYVSLRGGRTLTGHCYEEGSLSLPYLAFVEALRGYVVSRPPEDLRKELGTAATDLARIVSDVRERLSVEPRPAGDPEEARSRLLEAVSGFLRSASTVQPLLLILEDLHRADQGTLDLLLHLARNLQGARLLVAGSYRDVEVDRSHPLSATLGELRRGSSFSRVLLRGLGTPEVQRMLAAITGAEPPGSLAETIHRQTEGNPRFVQEVVRYLVEEGHLGHGGPNPRPLPLGGRGEEAIGVSAMVIPEGLRDVIGRRLSRLSPDCNRVLAIAAVIGRDFGLETLQTVAGLGEEPVVSALEESVHVGVLEEQSRPGSIRYRFAHAFFRQTLYEELIAPRRLRLHQQVAAALERQYANRLEEHAAELAEHFAQSTDRDDLAKAVRYGELAAARATSVYAYGEAARHLEQALAVQDVLDPDDKAKRCDLLLALGDALVSGGDSTRAREIVAAAALSLAESFGDRARASAACRIVLRTIDLSSASFVAAEGQKWSELADRYADDGTLDRVAADSLLAWAAEVRGDVVQGLSRSRQAVELALRLDDPAWIVRSSLGILNGNTVPPEQHDERLALAEELSRRSLGGISATSLAHAGLFLGYVYLTWGRREEAERNWQRAREAAMRSRDAEVAFVPFDIDALVLTLDGELDQVLRSAAEIRARGAEVDRRQAGRQLGARVVRPALYYLGRADEALPDIVEMQDLFFNRGIHAAQRSLCLAHMGREAEASDILHRMLAARDMTRLDDPTPGQVLALLLDAAVVLKDADVAKVLVARMARLAGLLYSTIGSAQCIGRLCGGAAALLGETEKARGYYEQAIEICTKVRFRPELALTRLELAELLLGQAGAINRAPTSGDVISSPLPEGEGRPKRRQRAQAAPGGGVRAGFKPAPTESEADLRAEALAHLDFAIGEFRGMKMQPSLERALRHKELLKA